MSDYEFILYEENASIATITFNRPDKLNAFTDPMMEELLTALELVENNSAMRAVILTGAGRAFSAGFDLSPRDEPIVSVQDWRTNTLRTARDVVLKIWSLRVPVITAVRGYALGGACDMMLACDLTVVATDAKIGEPEIKAVGSPPTLVMPWVISIKKTKELLLTGDLISGEEAVRIGMANIAVPADEVIVEAQKLADKIAALPQVAVELNKAAINHAYETMGMRSAIDYGVEIFTLLMKSEEAAAFNRAVEEKGLKAALAGDW